MINVNVIIVFVKLVKKKMPSQIVWIASVALIAINAINKINKLHFNSNINNYISHNNININQIVDIQ